MHINVSRGAKPVTVPDVTSQPFANAKSALNGQGFVVGRVGHPVGPAAGDRRRRGSAGRDVGAGGLEDHALRLEGAGHDPGARRDRPDARPPRRRSCTGAGLTPAVIFDQVTDPSQDGIVQSTDPAPGSDAKSGEVVTIHVGQLQSGTPGGTTTTTTPTTAGMSRRIAVILGGRSSENAISLASAASVITALEAGGQRGRQRADRPRGPLGARPAGDERRWNAATRLPGKEVATTLSDVDVVFPVLHGPFGEDGTVQGLLELANVPYVGAGVLGSALCMDKDVFKAVLRDHGIPVTENITLRARRRGAQPVRLPGVREAGAARLERRDHQGPRRGRARAAASRSPSSTTRRCSSSEFVSGVEVEVGVLGNQRPIASLPGEIVVTHNEWYDYEAKYDEGEMDLVVPARLTDEQIERAQELAVRAFVATECEGMARADMFVRDDGEVLVNELNTIPGFTATSVYARLFEASGIGYARAPAAAGRPGGRALRTPPAAPLLNRWRLLVMRDRSFGRTPRRSMICSLARRPSERRLSLVPVRPRARLTIEPDDFPYRTATRGHRRGESVRSVTLRNAAQVAFTSLMLDRSRCPGGRLVIQIR